MMRIMRENPVFVLGVIVFVVAVFVGSIFLVYGLKSGGGGGPTEGTVVAVVEGAEIPYSEYLSNYNSQIDFYRQFYPSMGLSDLEEKFRLKQRALDSMVNMRLLLAEAERMDLRVTDDELRSKIESTALFQEGGRFSPVKYRQVLSASRVVPAAYEESQRAEMLVGKVRDLVMNGVQVSDEEAWKAFRQDRDQVRLDLLALDVDSFRSWVSVEEGEVRDRYDDDPERYRRSARIKVAYIPLETAKLEQSLEVTEEDLANHYEYTRDRWKTPRQVKARHVLIKVPEDAGEERENELRERAEFVLQKAREGADFTELAREFSQDGSGPEGGDLGWFERGQMVPAFEEAAFALEAGELSEVVRTQFGFHVILVEEIREEGVKPLDEVRDEVAADFRKLEVRRVAGERAEEINDELYDGDFEEVADRNGLEVRRAERLTKEDILPGLGYRPEITGELFSLQEGEISEIYRQEGNYYIFKVEKKTPAYVPGFDEAAEEVREEILGEKALKKAREEAANLLEKIRSGTSFNEAAGMVKGKVTSTELFSRSGVVPAAGASGELFDQAFGLQEGQYGGPASTGRKVWVYQVVEVRPALREDFEAEKSALLQTLREEKREMAFQSWLEHLRGLRSIQVDEGLLGLSESSGETL